MQSDVLGFATSQFPSLGGNLETTLMLDYNNGSDWEANSSHFGGYFKSLGFQEISTKTERYPDYEAGYVAYYSKDLKQIVFLVDMQQLNRPFGGPETGNDYRAYLMQFEF